MEFLGIVVGLILLVQFWRGIASAARQQRCYNPPGRGLLHYDHVVNGTAFYSCYLFGSGKGDQFFINRREVSKAVYDAALAEARAAVSAYKEAVRRWLEAVSGFKYSNADHDVVMAAHRVGMACPAELASAADIALLDAAGAVHYAAIGRTWDNCPIQQKAAPAPGGPAKRPERKRTVVTLGHS